jgi:altronate hydrolase
MPLHEATNSEVSSKAIRLHLDDNVVVAVISLAPGDTVNDVVVGETVPAGHKIASRNIKAGEAVLKYSQVIGYAASEIPAGRHVHSHNLEYRPSAHDYEYSVALRSNVEARNESATFMGFRRASGKVGTRNYIAVLTSVNCSATAARNIAAAFGSDRLSAYPNVDGVVAFTHGTGCGMADSGDGFANLQRVIWGYARNPNVAGVLLVGLGCEVNQIDFLLEAYGIERGPLFQTMNIQAIGGLRKCIDAGIERVEAMLPEANSAKRVECPASDLVLGLQCGGSDGWSGITANPALGYASDLLVAHGGTTVLSETPEIYGAEHLLTRRAIDRRTGEKLLERVAWWEEYVARNSGSMDNNPSPGNKRGGLTTILEKSLGAVAKGGTSPLMGVYRYGEPIERKGFVYMDSPGFDPCSVTGQVASGCNIIAFTTGRGSAFGCKPSPSIKIATNQALYDHMPEDMDINAGAIVSGGETTETVGRAIFNELLEVASGKKTKSEAQGLGELEFVPWQIGAVM